MPSYSKSIPGNFWRHQNWPNPRKSCPPAPNSRALFELLSDLSRRKILPQLNSATSPLGLWILNKKCQATFHVWPRILVQLFLNGEFQTGPHSPSEYCLKTFPEASFCQDFKRGKECWWWEPGAGGTAIKIRAAPSTNRIITQNLHQSYKLCQPLCSKTKASPEIMIS